MGCLSRGVLTGVLACLLAGCSLLGISGASGGKDPFADGVLTAVGALAPPGSPTQYLAQIASNLGWEDQVQRNTLLRTAIEKREFNQVVQPFLLALFYKNGFSVLPTVGEGHQFGRDTIVRGAAGNLRLMVTTRDPIRIIFLGPVDNIQVVYPQDGKQPEVFSVSGTGLIAVRRSLLEQYLQ